MGKIHVVSCNDGAQCAAKKVLLGAQPLVGVACTGINVGPQGICCEADAAKLLINDIILNDIEQRFPYKAISMYDNSDSF